MRRFPADPMMELPPGTKTQCAGNDNDAPDLFGDAEDLEDAGDGVEPLPPYLQTLFNVAGVPPGLGCGDTLTWIDASGTSTEFKRARVCVEAGGAWIEFTLSWTTGREQRLRTTRYLNVVALEDSGGFSDAEPLATAAGRLLTDFRAATVDLLLTH